MQHGAYIVFQPRLESRQWNGWAVFLIKVENQSGPGNCSYEVLDTKLSKETKTGAILQISPVEQDLQSCFSMHYNRDNPIRVRLQ